MIDPYSSGRSRGRGSPYNAAGWLFADLLLALAILFLVANTLGIKPPPTAPPPPPTATPIPTATPLVRLDTNPKTFTLIVDWQGLLASSPSATRDVMNQVRREAVLQHRRAGLVIVYGGAPDQSGVTTAEAVASKVEDVLQTLGNQGFVFIDTSYHSPLFSLQHDFGYVAVEVYLYAQQT